MIVMNVFRQNLRKTNKLRKVMARQAAGAGEDKQIDISSQGHTGNNYRGKGRLGLTGRHTAWIDLPGARGNVFTRSPDVVGRIRRRETRTYLEGVAPQRRGRER